MIEEHCDLKKNSSFLKTEFKNSVQSFNSEHKHTHTIEHGCWKSRFEMREKKIISKWKWLLNQKKKVTEIYQTDVNEVVYIDLIWLKNEWSFLPFFSFSGYTFN